MKSLKCIPPEKSTNERGPIAHMFLVTALLDVLHFHLRYIGFVWISLSWACSVLRGLPRTAPSCGRHIGSSTSPSLLGAAPAMTSTHWKFHALLCRRACSKTTTQTRCDMRSPMVHEQKFPLFLRPAFANFMDRHKPCGETLSSKGR
eukprot:5377109-Amphidinium_carterae.1